ncbi:MAG TPA: LysM peptidoglycan-binding domain-containing protein [Gaiellaceae bacterium]|nr:LysM peptidoglycan-binding domain-containing protein [Gaiellaceae bacterium]
MAPADWRRYVAPAAFLLAATIAVILIRSGVEAGGSRRTVTTAGSPAPRKHVVTTTSATTTTKTPATKRYWTVAAGDTFGVISAKSGVPVATIERLNPNVHSTSLFIGEKIRLK